VSVAQKGPTLRPPNINPASSSEMAGLVGIGTQKYKFNDL
jgi:DNA uptake protein ComE-like DNA-binding protein